ncbi:NAD+ synthetase [Thioflavicoccus mobilis 8321]|uniref:Glutamine-dependent NAD(+) synthetase n=2 Tax=Thioflavicoccus mobilis TaxID=80679 RepID=L0GYN1_9GAMM|nr:NAD+ synthetase [Thioflavicoccus mobilis 8321]
MRILLAQMNPLVGDVAGNTDQILALAAAARDRQAADLVVFPELALTGYPPEDLLLRPELIARVTAALERLRHELRGITAIVGYPRASVAGLHNVAGVIRDGELVAEYAKQTLPNYSVFDEKRYFLPGQAPCLFLHEGRRLGLTICEDIWEEGPARQAVEAGAELLININASPYHQGKQAQREELVGMRAREHGVAILYVNLVGGQDELVFDGGSFAVDAKGCVVRRAPSFEPAELVVEFAAESASEATGQAFAAPLQPVPGPLASVPDEEAGIYQALVLGVRDYVRKNGFRGAVLGLSGGIDSALTLAVAVDALGADQVEAVLMPSRYTAEMSVQDAEEEARRLGVAWRIIPIEPAFDAFLWMLREAFAGAAADVTEENIQARCRGVVMMAISNKAGKILLTTGNKSEMAVGYATLYGDMAGGFAPIKDCAKTLVYRLARYRNRLAPVIPERVLERAPSAELAPNQTDQDSLPPYPLLDEILRRYIELDQGISEIVAAGLPEPEVRRVTRLVDRNEYKRRQAPPGVRITSRAFGRDRRYPITSGF